MTPAHPYRACWLRTTFRHHCAHAGLTYYHPFLSLACSQKGASPTTAANCSTSAHYGVLPRLGAFCHCTDGTHTFTSPSSYLCCKHCHAITPTYCGVSPPYLSYLLHSHRTPPLPRFGFAFCRGRCAARGKNHLTIHSARPCCDARRKHMRILPASARALFALLFAPRAALHCSFAARVYGVPGSSRRTTHCCASRAQASAAPLKHFGDCALPVPLPADLLIPPYLPLKPHLAPYSPIHDGLRKNSPRLAT